ncbi:MAG: arginyl-transferase family protein [Alphaproteobacteria bacterium]
MPDFYISAPLPCPYIEGLEERKLFTLIDEQMMDDTVINRLNSLLVEKGFRRSQNILYRPACDSCSACVPVRLVVGAGFTFSRSARRLLQHNSDLTCHIMPAIAETEHFELFSAYQQHRHENSSMASMDWKEFKAMVEQAPSDTCLWEWRDPTGKLLACCLVDHLINGYSAVYSFFEPTLSKRGLGSFMVWYLARKLLERVQQARAPRDLYVYLGYWIRQCHKMAYKVKFQPMQRLSAEGWRDIEIGDMVD